MFTEIKSTRLLFHNKVLKRIVLGLLLFIFFVQPTQAQHTSKEYIHRPFQFTFLVPPFSTNGRDNENITNDVSLNLFAGYSGGVDVFEAGTFVNLNKYYVKGVQLAGFGNVVGDYVSGIQFAGFGNIVGDDMSGLQLAGFSNIVGDYMSGLQLAGFSNIVGDNMSGVQLSAFSNIAGSYIIGIQGSGFLNVTDEVDGFQIAGFSNMANEVNGLQIAGFMNIAGHVNGTQIAGFINICDSIEGIPIGLISIVKQDAYRKLLFTASEIQYANISYKIGVKHFYNIYSFGKPTGAATRWMIGSGFGTEIDLNEKLKLNVEGTVHQELWIGDSSCEYFLTMDRLNLYNTVSFLFGWDMSNDMTIRIGPSLNVSVANTNPDCGDQDYNEISPYSFYDNSWNNKNQTNVQTWAGVQGGISF